MQMLLVIVFFIVSFLNIYSQRYVDAIETCKNPKTLHNIQVATKPMLMPLLMSIYAVFAVPLGSFDWHLIIALIFGWLGDLALMVHHQTNGLKHINAYANGSEPETDMKPIMIGLLFFLCGHITYFTLFIKSSLSLTGTNALFFLIYIGYIGYALIIYTYLNQHGILKPKDDGMISKKNSTSIMKIAVMIYMIVITLMSYSSLLRLLNLEDLPSLFTFIGSLVFMSSDTVLSFKMLGKNENMSEQYIMGSYILAQSLIVISFII